MKIQTWEIATLDWSEIGDHGIVLSPTSVADLINAKSTKEALSAYDDIVEATGLNGWVYPCALPVVKTILAALPGCRGAARRGCLDLLGVIAGAESAPKWPNIHRDCLIELRLATWCFVYGIQFDDVELVCSHVDILGVLGAEFEELRPIAKKYIELSLTRNLSEGDVEIVRNTLAHVG